ncbi:hypothetical protein Deipr_0321 [Deinococcus proteolyticus MRP]|uniref:Uncharacterized protein n=2 Tax=Deinococcaceae TaxID=183710 RepID=F0RJF2_DEIPM|nr:hypothetical protein Deipr_0321 [Deinococcus proteolyticus MRP]
MSAPWVMAGLCLPVALLISSAGVLCVDEWTGFSQGIHDSNQTSLGNGYFISFGDAPDHSFHLSFPNERESKWQVVRVGCSGKDIVMQSGNEPSLYAHLTPQGGFIDNGVSMRC